MNDSGFWVVCKMSGFTEKETLAKLQKELKKLSRNYNSNIKSIEKYTKKIKNAEKDNKSNLKKQAETSKRQKSF